MPTYEYKCEICGLTFDVQASIQEKYNGLKPVCPVCDSSETRQVISGGLFIRAGAGSYFNPPGVCAPSTGLECCG